MSHNKQQYKILSLSDRQPEWQTLLTSLFGGSGAITLVHSLKQLWDQLAAVDDYNCLLIDQGIDIEIIYDLLASIPTLPDYQNLPVVLLLTNENMMFKADFQALGANATIPVPENVKNPIFESVFISEIEQQISNYITLKGLQKSQGRITAVQNLEEGRFIVRTREEAQAIASLLSSCAEQPTLLAIGIAELAINGVEHGMLGITSDQKSDLIQRGVLSEEIHRLSSLSENTDKYVTICYEKQANKAIFVIEDTGDGFDYDVYLDEKYIDEQNKKMAKHGRGIGMAKACFSSLNYLGNGNCVKAVFDFSVS